MRSETDPEKRKALPITTGVLDYFPDALLAVAECSRVGNDQHSPGEPLHWAKEKSQDEPDALVRHLLDRGTFDTDGVRHSAKVAWRALALLQREIEGEEDGTESVLQEPDGTPAGGPDAVEDRRGGQRPPEGAGLLDTRGAEAHEDRVTVADHSYDHCVVCRANGRGRDTGVGADKPAGPWPDHDWL